ncbi:hypothetical protein [Cyanobium gracile]|uniref:Uncharacterized protein n=1 Tax=Cyanobium gracile UHCC 0281 TaxID=3110309 RepID=A0ABU5SVZ6_9CYAN|nr:hypothetical protein [Cyanobium gracile]MEA5442608.1 hypothetical protein [Cyanobium gracile UHCC 0281]
MPSFPLSSLGWVKPTLIPTGLPIGPTAPARSGSPLLTLSGPGQSAVLLVNTAFGSRAQLPQRLVQRFAIDWIQLEPGNRLAQVDPTRNLSYPQFGREALAVAEATVVHVHVMDGPSPLASNGLPYVIDRFAVTGLAVSATDLDVELRLPLKPVRVLSVSGPALRRDRLPADLQVVRFLP